MSKEYKLTIEFLTAKGTVITEKLRNKLQPNLIAILVTLEVLSKKNGK